MKATAELIVDILAQSGVKDVVCSPGSRNAPLLLAFDACEKIHKHIVIDERSAAFAALGMAATSQSPVAIVCTSGTALLNYAPAVAEAYYRHIPLIVISADRPAEWIDQDDSQTIRQFCALSNFVKKSYDLPDRDCQKLVDERFVVRCVNDAMLTAKGAPMGPVHLNVQFDEPLTPSGSLSGTLRPINIGIDYGTDTLAPSRIKELAKECAGKKILLVAGFGLPDHKLTRSINHFSSLENVYVMTEVGSNLHTSAAPIGIDTILSSMSEEELETMKPDIVITIGGALVSRFLKKYMRNCTHTEHWAVGHSHMTIDCFLTLTRRIECSPAQFFGRLASEISRIKSGETSYKKEWMKISENALKRQEEFIADAPWSDIRALNLLFSQLPKEYNLHLSNGTPIRYAQLLTRHHQHAAFCNRGVSGIDGCTSTAIGGAWAYPAPTLLLTGDMSMTYDIGALGLEAPQNFKIVVVSNGGGAIFRFVGSTSQLDEEQKDKYFCVPPHTDFRQLAAAYGYRYLEATDETSMKAALEKLFSADERKTILNIVTDGELSGQLLKKLLRIKI